MIFAKLSTAITIPFGPVLDSTGAEFTTAVVAEVKISKNNGTPAALNVSATLTHREVGIYELVLTTSDISAVGQATITLSKTTYVAPPVHLIVLPAKVYDSFIAGTDNLEVDAIQWLGVAPLALSAQQVQAVVPTTQKVDVETIKTQAVAVTAAGTVTFPNATVASTTNITAGTIATVTNAVTLPSIPADWITAAGIANGAIDAATFAAGAINAAAIADGAIDNATFAADVGSTAYATNIIALAADKALVQQRLDELLSADSDIDGLAPPTVGSVFHELLTKTAGSFTYDQTTDSLEALRDRGDAAWITATGFALATVCTEGRLAELDAANLPTDVANVKTDTAAILIDTAVIGAAGAGLTAIPWNATWDAEVQSECADAITAASLSTLTAAQVNAEVVDVLNVDVLVDGKTIVAGLQIIAAGVLGKVSGAGTGTEVFVGINGATTRATVTVDASGNRTAVVFA